ncbi:CDP-diacylglycerol--glycerol-3-phosphate 3-phosphatidyltransferase [Sorangium cellulosum]|uniref:CDP-diacylglycerol--glycerol-3-phosphate 3-phosphatidyltransferase n=1 Tax=Sorangium cellulosum TaxID=56 RepID=A0A2L0ELF5_SORCE|nr:CDP-alcohol phosphatidyltransferase family protein [Sorangium cellulosum]AUX40133.1 CDP-diacylglycerol--glycerol-3-phosphate 3-phosphatidyltransferase [Sorangium cellulosum]
MTTLSVRDLALPPNLMSLARLPLAALFPVVATRPALALVVLCCAGLTDVLDGWLARRSGQVTRTGAIVDPIADKVFALAVVVTLLASGALPLWGIPALLTRELLELPLALWIALSSRFRGARLATASANIPGKLATVVQFAAVFTAIAFPEVLPAMLAAAAVAGVAAGASYWARQLRRAPAAAKTPPEVGV